MTFFFNLDAHTQGNGKRDKNEEVGEKRQEEGAAVWRVRGGYLKREHHYFININFLFGDIWQFFRH